MALVGIIMGSTSDWDTMRHAADILATLGVAHETKVVSAHRTPARLYDYATTAADRGLKVVIAGAGGAAHLPGMAAAMTRLPVLGVIGKAGAINAGLLAAAILATADADLAARLIAWRAAQTASVADAPAA